MKVLFFFLLLIGIALLVQKAMVSPDMSGILAYVPYVAAIVFVGLLVYFAIRKPFDHYRRYRAALPRRR